MKAAVREAINGVTAKQPPLMLTIQDELRAAHARFVEETKKKTRVYRLPWGRELRMATGTEGHQTFLNELRNAIAKHQSELQAELYKKQEEAHEAPQKPEPVVVSRTPVPPPQPAVPPPPPPPPEPVTLVAIDKAINACDAAAKDYKERAEREEKRKTVLNALREAFIQLGAGGLEDTLRELLPAPPPPPAPAPEPLRAHGHRIHVVYDEVLKIALRFGDTYTTTEVAKCLIGDTAVDDAERKRVRVCVANAMGALVSRGSIRLVTPGGPGKLGVYDNNVAAAGTPA